MMSLLAPLSTSLLDRQSGLVLMKVSQTHSSGSSLIIAVDRTIL
ncbi:MULTISPECIES: hypothetical protein [unclassified Chamaesiphon]|nr:MULTISPECIES: hypothetical protein [unclassified Chamaesiphon]